MKSHIKFIGARVQNARSGLPTDSDGFRGSVYRRRKQQDQRGNQQRTAPRDFQPLPVVERPTAAEWPPYHVTWPVAWWQVLAFFPAAKCVVFLWARDGCRRRWRFGSDVIVVERQCLFNDVCSFAENPKRHSHQRLQFRYSGISGVLPFPKLY